MSNESWFKKTLKKAKLYGLGLLFSSAPLTASAQQESTLKAVPDKQLADAKPVVSNKIEKLQKDLQDGLFAHYKELNINLDSMQPQEVAHVFESACNPCITDGNKSILHAKYLGLCQMDINTTLPKFIETKCKNSKHFSSLYKFKKNKTIRSTAFMQEWRKLSHGPHAAEFENQQFIFMFESHYQNIFDRLAETGYFPKITLDNCASSQNFIYTAAVMSCANQNPKRTPEIFLRTLNDKCKDELKKNGIKPKNSYNSRIDNKNRIPALKKDLEQNISLLIENGLEIDDNHNTIALETYETKKVVFGKMGGRYTEERKLLEEKAERLQKQALLQSLKSSPVIAQTIEKTDPDLEKTNFSFYPDIQKEIDNLHELNTARKLVSSNQTSKSQDLAYESQSILPSEKHNVSISPKQLTLADIRRERIKNSRQKV